MGDFATSLQVALNAATLVAILWGLWKMIAVTREARAARTAAITAAERAADAARLAATHAESSTKAIAAVSKKVDGIEASTNGLLAEAKRNGNLEGRAELTAEQAAEKC